MVPEDSLLCSQEHATGPSRFRCIQSTSSRPLSLRAILSVIREFQGQGGMESSKERSCLIWSVFIEIAHTGKSKVAPVI